MTATKQLPLGGRDAVTVSARDFNYARGLWRLFLLPPPSFLPDEWAEREPLRFNYSESLKGPCDFTGRNYLRRPIRDAANPAVRKQKKIFGRGNGKTLISEIKKCYKLKFHPGTRGLCVWPAAQGEGSSTDYVNGRLGKTIEATKCLNDLIPSAGQKRFVINGKKIILNGSSYGFVGAGSGSKGVGNRLNEIDFDEIEKYPIKLKNEGSIINLAEGATKGVADYQIDYSSTPTIEEGLMWQAIQKSNLHLYFLPCPHCSSLAQNKTGLNSPEILSKDHAKLIASILHRKKNSALEEEDRAALALREKFKGWFIILFSEQYAAGYPRKFVSEDAALNGMEIPAATVRFRFHETSTKENPVNDARGKDGTWNYERAVANARIECPHCKKAIRDYDPVTKKTEPAQKIWMDAHGAWVCVKPGEPGDIGYMINSLYSPVINQESTWGGYTMEFISALEEGGEAVRTFVNSILAGVYANQQHADKSVIEITNRILTAGNSLIKWRDFSGDRQARYPGFWYRVREWIVSVLSGQKTLDQFVAWLKELPSEEKTLIERLAGTLATPTKDSPLYSPSNIVAQITRTDQWPKIADWLIANGLTGAKLTEFFQVEFQTDLIRMLEFICKQPAVNIALGKQGDSEMVEFGSADSWEEIDDVQRRWKIANPDMIMDARFGAMDNAEVFAECFRRCPPAGFCHYSPLITPFGPRGKFSKTPMPGYRPFAEWGWTPVLGYPEHKVWPSKEKIRLPYTQEVNDPFVGKMEARQFYQYVFKFDAQWALSELARIRKKYAFTVAADCKFSGHTSDQRPVTKAEYDLHLKGYYWNEKENRWDAPGKLGGSQSRRHPNHGYDCEKNGAARAVWKGIFRYERQAAAGNQQ